MSSLHPAPFPSSPADSNFTPRKEFVQTPLRLSSFALLVFSSNNAIRLSNFPPPLVTAVRSLLESIVGLRLFRQNSEHKLCEFVLIGKPWSNPRSLSTEVVLVQVFTVLLTHGFSFLSQLDYGREHNDRLSLAFSKPASPSPNTISSGQPKSPFVPFALSFPSPTVLRVVCAPLHATPAILQSVRGAWPRGVTSEKKIGEGCFEFKLKGYSWFQEDTFPEDALAYILTLLTALDKHSWTLLTSLSLTSTRTRTKDLWVFSGPGPGSSPPKDVLATAHATTTVHLGTPLSPSTYEPIVDHPVEVSGSGDSEGSGSGSGCVDTSRDAKAQVSSPTADPLPTTLGRNGSTRLSKLPREGHRRVASDSSSTVLRKKVPPIQTFDELMPGEEQSLQPRHTDHDIIPGPTPQTTYATPLQFPYPPPQPPLPHPQTDTIHVSDLPTVQQLRGRGSPGHDTSMGPPPSHSLVSLPEPADRHHSDEDFHEIDASHHENTSAATLHPPSPNAFTPQCDVPTPPLLAPSAFLQHSSDEFRDSAFSDVTGQSYNVPIAWIPGGEMRKDERVQRGPAPLSAFRTQVNMGPDDRSSVTTGPQLPGGWASTPATEVDDPTAALNRDVMPERQNTTEPRSPEIVRRELLVEGETNKGSSGEETWRKSEAGVLGVVPSLAGEAPPVPQPEQLLNGHAETDQLKEKEGWVLVSVAADPNSNSFAPAPVPVPMSPSSTDIPPAAATAAAQALADTSPPSALPPGTTHVPLSAVQCIAAADAVSSAVKSTFAPAPTPTPASPAPTPPEKSALSRLFSRRRGLEGGVQKVKSADRDAPDSDKGKEKSPRFKRKGGVLPTIRSGRRISID